MNFPLKNLNNHFCPLFNASHHVLQFQKNLINRLRDKFKNNNLGPKNTPFSILGLDTNLPKKSETVTLNHFIRPVIRYDFK